MSLGYANVFLKISNLCLCRAIKHWGASGTCWSFMMLNSSWIQRSDIVVCSNVDLDLSYTFHYLLFSYYITIHCDLLFRELFTDFRIRILFLDIRWIDRLSLVFFVKANIYPFTWGGRGGRKGKEELNEKGNLEIFKINLIHFFDRWCEKRFGKYSFFNL